jgi:hypothetical protein
MCKRLRLEKRAFLCYIFLMIIEQTVEIPVSHQIMLDVPHEIPAGKTRVIIQFPVFSKPKLTEKTAEVKTGEKPALSHADFLSGILASAGDITLEQIREERLSKYLK